jgi:hypothetical protein
MRPQKTTVDYFPHRTTSGKTIAILENLYGNNGYAAWFKILELLGATQGHFYDFSTSFGLQFLAAKIGVSVTETTAILNTCSELEAIDPEMHADGIIWSQNFVDGLEGVYAKRGKNAPAKPCFRNRNTAKPVVSVPETGVSVTEMQQRKGKERKVKESRDNLKIIRRTGFEDFNLSDVDPRITISILEAFVDHRKKIRKPLTPYALSLVCRDAVKVHDQYGIDPGEAIQHVISMGWQGCNPKYFEPRQNGRSNKTSRQQYMEDVVNLLENIDETANNGRPMRLGQAAQPLSGVGPQHDVPRKIGV